MLNQYQLKTIFDKQILKAFEVEIPKGNYIHVEDLVLGVIQKPSLTKATKLVQSNQISVNGVKILDPEFRISKKTVGKHFLLGIGRKELYIFKINVV